MRNLLLLSTAVAAVGSALIVQSVRAEAPIAAPAAAATTDVDPVVVIGTRSRRLASNTPGTVSVIDAEQIETILATDIKDLIQYATPGKIAGFFAESIQGVGGVVVFPDGYLQEAYRIVRGAGGICIADEVQAGFGRTGTDAEGRFVFDTIKPGPVPGPDDTMQAPDGVSGVHTVPNSLHSAGFLTPRRMAPHSQAGLSAAAMVRMPKRTSASRWA